MSDTRLVNVNGVKIGNGNPLVLIAGPCVIEDEESCIMHAKALKKIAYEEGFPYIFKASYDKANRSSIHSFRGPGLEKGLRILQTVKDKTECPVISDVHCREEMEEASKVLDIVQVPAFLSRQTDFIIEAVKKFKIVNIKKGQFLSPYDVKNIIEKIKSAGGENLLITERGSSFGYNNLVSDMRSLPIIRAFGYPVVYDATHSVQLPGGLGNSSGGQRQFVSALSRAATAVGCDAVFMEVHINPDNALCDGPNMINFEQLRSLLKQLKAIEQAVKQI